MCKEQGTVHAFIQHGQATSCRHQLLSLLCVPHLQALADHMLARAKDLANIEDLGSDISFQLHIRLVKLKVEEAKQLLDGEQSQGGADSVGSAPMLSQQKAADAIALLGSAMQQVIGLRALHSRVHNLVSYCQGGRIFPCPARSSSISQSVEVHQLQVDSMSVDDDDPDMQRKASEASQIQAQVGAVHVSGVAMYC